MDTGIIVIAFIIVGVCVLWFLANKASDIAVDKGYGKLPWLYICIFLLPIGLFLVAAMPDKNLQEKQEETNRLLRNMLKEMTMNQDIEREKRE